MITIEDVREYLLMHYVNEHDIQYPEAATKNSIAELAIAQHEEIESLKTILREVEHLAGAERGNICIRIIRMKDEIEMLGAANKDLQECVERSLPLLRGHVHGMQTAAMCEAVLGSLKSGEPK